LKPGYPRLQVLQICRAKVNRIWL
jgi:hypothetical protein